MNCNLNPNPCPYRESGMVQCELENGHENDLFGTWHWFSPHTIMHDISGNGYTCQEIDKYLAAGEWPGTRYHVIGF